ncbi:hypothetical protein KIN20_018646 [Parelaphostrongylus tenuis]|uniref:Uncharacterized protein n=1 Tax=Parelaphostrongylus tenuis TaxID=148309 RepID=A0AAD5QPR8_PARTN|nr:hypothetical protein KIN20_018646 [Parelaphostrongylus tenuis]
MVFTSCEDLSTYFKWYIADRAYEIPWLPEATLQRRFQALRCRFQGMDFGDGALTAY